MVRSATSSANDPAQDGRMSRVMVRAVRHDERRGGEFHGKYMTRFDYG
jgi:hypothetical protein